MGLWTTVRHYGRLVRLSHTVFGLPFTFAAAALAHRAAAEGWLGAGVDGMTWAKMIWILVAFTGARTAAMGFNRIVDRDIDGANPRTADRELPSGKISLRASIVMTTLATVAFVAAAWALGPLALALSPLCIVVIFGYSLFKRFSWASHLLLGVALALAPAGAWVAVTGGLRGFSTPALLMGAVATWVAGFDVLYSLQDESFDRERGLHSIPVRFGARGAIIISALLHACTVAGLVTLHVHEGLGTLHAAGVVLVTGILVYEHWIVGPGKLERINKAFFDLNGYISIGYLLCVLLDLFV